MMFFMSVSVFRLFFGRLDSFLSVVFLHCKVSIRVRLDKAFSGVFNVLQNPLGVSATS